MSTEVALPTSSDRSQWTPEETALVEAAGLVHTDSQTGAKTLADRPVVAAFLQHCKRTGLDPIARQIYSIARKSKGQLKWQIQVSIDGARLVAERSGQYEGQTTPEYTADGMSWTQVWLADEPPKAARVGVYRRGFREPLYAVALWDAYVQTNYQGDPSEMWKKMGPLMLGKCAEMLALRKAFPQDLSGLYSTEEMDQAGTPVQAAVVAEPSGIDWEQLASEATSRGALNDLWQRIGRDAPHERTPQLEARFREFSQSLIAAAVAPVAAQEEPEPEEPAQGWPVAQTPDGGAQESEADRG
ncbi:phage recombination protein Bet [Clavibacter michiganensis]|uniref:phage recombination protein Bet n=1 Tax=Clavibacter michiganensis TaxID=28447 RepID=UPI0015E300DE|nr:phage recombination protein Bet [Clavibacter michiganensis]